MLILDLLKESTYSHFISQLNAFLGGSAVIEFWTDPVPTAIDDPDTGTLVATCTLDSVPWQGVVSDLSNANAIAPDNDTDAGTVTYARMRDGSGGTTYLQFSCGTGSEEITFDDNVFSLHDTLTVTSLTLGFNTTS